jgi:multisubunit Na+/H+ antiporter MnhB subunit
MATDWKFMGAAGGCILLFAMIVASYAVNLKPDSAQNKSLIAMIIVTACIASILGYLMAYIGLKGDVTSQVHFLMAAVMILFATNIVSGSVAALQLYGLRDAVATNKQGCP